MSDGLLVRTTVGSESEHDAIVTNRTAVWWHNHELARDGASAIKAFHLLLLLILAVHRRDLVVYHREAIGEDQLDIEYVAEPTRTAPRRHAVGLIICEEATERLEPFHSVPSKRLRSQYPGSSTKKVS